MHSLLFGFETFINEMIRIIQKHRIYLIKYYFVPYYNTYILYGNFGSDVKVTLNLTFDSSAVCDPSSFGLKIINI